MTPNREGDPVMRVTIEISEEEAEALRTQMAGVSLGGWSNAARTNVACLARDALPRPIQTGDRVRPVDDSYSMVGVVVHVANDKAWVNWDLQGSDGIWRLASLVRVDGGES